MCTGIFQCSCFTFALKEPHFHRVLIIAVHKPNRQFLLCLHTLTCVLKVVWQNWGVKGRRAVWAEAVAHRRQNISNKQGDLRVTHGFSGPKEFWGTHSLRLFIALLSVFLLTVGTWYSILQFLGHLWFEIKHHYNNSLSSVQSVDFFFPHSFTSTSLHQVPHKTLITAGLYILSVGSDFTAVTDYGNVLRRVITLLHVCPSYVGQHHGKTAQ